MRLRERNSIGVLSELTNSMKNMNFPNERRNSFESKDSGHSQRSHSSRRRSPASSYPLRSREANRRTNSEVKEEYEQYDGK